MVYEDLCDVIYGRRNLQGNRDGNEMDIQSPMQVELDAQIDDQKNFPSK